jgi:aldehyde dehydrogenase (NAD+)
LREHLDDLADLVSLEVGKIRSEARGEVQEMVDICDFAVGLSRSSTAARCLRAPGHRLAETWHPLGVVGVISAFNFPVAVWSWNTAVALVCGDTVVWKPSELTPLTALACSACSTARLPSRAPAGLGPLVLGDAAVAERLVDTRASRWSAPPGRCGWAARSGPRVAARFGQQPARARRTQRDRRLAVGRPRPRGARDRLRRCGTAGQRCTTPAPAASCRSRSRTTSSSAWSPRTAAAVGNPFDAGPLVGPLVNAKALRRAAGGAGRTCAADGGEVLVAWRRVLADRHRTRTTWRRRSARSPAGRRGPAGDVRPLLPRADLRRPRRRRRAAERRAAGLSSSIFTGDQAEAERFLAADGADCGIVNVNIGTVGAEIGGAFGGQKETAAAASPAPTRGRRTCAGRQHRQLQRELPLAQGVDFSV